MFGLQQNPLLIVEDVARPRTFLGAHPDAPGYDVSAASTGDEAVRMFRVFDPTLVLLTADSRSVDGMDTLERLKQISPSRSA